MSEILTFSEDEETIKKLDKLAKQKMSSRSEIVRVAVRDYVTRKLELIEIQKLAAKRYTEGKLSFDELVDILGYEEAKKIVYYTKIAEESFKGL